MPVTVTSIEKKPRTGRLELHLEGREPLTVTTDMAVLFALRTGATLSDSRLEELRAAQEREDAMAAALRLVSYRPRSEKELRERIGKRCSDPSLVEAVITRLKELRLVDDAAFAATWVDVRDRSAPRSRRLMASELRLKGIGRDAASSAAGSIDEGDAAYRAGLKKALLLAGKPYEEFRRKVGDLLLRRGFTYETAAETVRRLREETGGGGDIGVDDVP
jgi:regulatory protein